MHIFFYSTHRELSNNTIISSIEVCIEMLCHMEVDLLVLAIVIRADATSTPLLMEKGIDT